MFAILAKVLISYSVFAETSNPENPAWTWEITPEDIYVDTPVVQLKIYPSFGEVPRSSRWYDPQGIEVACCKSGDTTRDYKYDGMSLLYIIDYFYVDGMDRTPGVYTVKACENSVCSPAAFEDTFTIKEHISNHYLPLVIR